MAQSILDAPIATTTFVVIDVETTGVTTYDEIIELAAVVLPPGEEPTAALNTLVRPSRPVRGTSIHGLTDDEVKDAPTMGDLIAPLRAVLANRVLAAHNAAFDTRYLRTVLPELPHVCTIGLYTLLGIGPAPSLRQACSYVCGFEMPDTHVALDDAMAAARLLRALISRLHTKKLRTFRDLYAAEHRVYRESLLSELLTPPAMLVSEHTLSQKPRGGRPTQKTSRLREYQSLLLEVLEDLKVTDQEVDQVRARRLELGIADDELRAIHARIMMAMVGRYAEDRRIDDTEREHMRRLHECLLRLGWAPGS